MLEQVFFSGWEPVARTAISTTVAYLILVVLLRIAGPRVLAKWYAFDLIVTVALGSSFASNVLSKDTTIAQAAVGFLLLILLQVIVSWVVLHWSAVRIVVNAEPALMLHNGEFQDQPMRRQRVAEADIRAAARQHGHASLVDVGAVIVEPDGTFSVIGKLSGSRSALADIPELGGSTNANRAR
jgi:uncharacterized membrane protein YcaP (DUF421 family)